MNCTHFVTRKKRNCRMTVIPGGNFCAEHQPIKKDSSSEQKPADGSSALRIVCPLDPKHTCYAHKLRKHLQICNARPKEEPPYIVKNLNSGNRSSSEPIETLEEDSFKQLSSFSTIEINSLIDKINQIYEKQINEKPIIEKILKHSILEAEVSKPEFGDKSKKHLLQASSILALLDEYNLLQPKSCFIEFGAGRGQLSYWIAQATATADDSLFLLVERASPKHKRDNKLDKSEDKVQRIRADIKDLDLDKVEIIGKAKYVVGATKHLCGEATDLTIRCLTKMKENNAKVLGCVMTFCCHHRCRWTPYTGKEFFAKMDLSKSDFEMMCGMSSWATCGDGFSRERRQNNNQADLDPNNKAPNNTRDQELGLNRDEKEEIGRRCKTILNWGRLDFLEKYNFHCRLHYYVDKSVSLENVCIVAYKKDE